MSATLTGVVCFYGVPGSVGASLYVQSYTLSSSFISEDTAVDEAGITRTYRADDRTSELSIDGIVKTISPPKLGDVLSFTIHTNSSFSGSATAANSFTGTVTKVDEKSGNKEWCKVSVTAKSWEGITIS